jgi:hypothetical protein
MDDADAPRWLSYDELAESRGISRPSAIRLARRRKWARMEGNDGTARVAVPPGDEIARGVVSDDATRVMAAAFEAGLTTLRTKLQEERQRADRLQAELTDLRIVLAVERAATRSWLFRLCVGKGAKRHRSHRAVAPGGGQHRSQNLRRRRMAGCEAWQSFIPTLA